MGFARCPVAVSRGSLAASGRQPRPPSARGANCQKGYRPATRRYRGRRPLAYPWHDLNLSQVFAGQLVGVRQETDRIWLVSFMHYHLGYFDNETCRLEPVQNPFEPPLSPIHPE